MRVEIPSEFYHSNDAESFDGGNQNQKTKYQCNFTLNDLKMSAQQNEKLETFLGQRKKAK